MTPNRHPTLVGFSLPPQLEESPFPLERQVYRQQAVIIPPPRRSSRPPPAQTVDANRPVWGWAALGVMAMIVVVMWVFK